jgi:hypothetical protein
MSNYFLIIFGAQQVRPLAVCNLLEETLASIQIIRLGNVAP